MHHLLLSFVAYLQKSGESLYLCVSRGAPGTAALLCVVESLYLTTAGCYQSKCEYIWRSHHTWLEGTHQKSSGSLAM